MEELIVTDIQVTEGIPLGVSEARHGEELLQGTEGEADHHLFRPAHATELEDIAEAAAQFAFAPQFGALPPIDLAPLLV